MSGKFQIAHISNGGSAGPFLVRLVANTGGPSLLRCKIGAPGPSRVTLTASHPYAAGMCAVHSASGT
jgi:hypothetical protein